MYPFVIYYMNRFCVRIIFIVNLCKSLCQGFPVNLKFLTKQIQIGIIIPQFSVDYINRSIGSFGNSSNIISLLRNNSVRSNIITVCGNGIHYLKFKRKSKCSILLMLYEIFIIKSFSISDPVPIPVKRTSR